MVIEVRKLVCKRSYFTALPGDREQEGGPPPCLRPAIRPGIRVGTKIATFDHTRSEHAIFAVGIGEISILAKCYYLHHLIGGDVRSLLRTISFSLSVMCLAHPARAATTDEDMCRNGLFPSLLKDVRIATFAGAVDSRLYFFDDTDGCPSSGAKCQSRSYVVPGDELIVSKQHGDWSCAWYAGKTRETVGWVRNRQLQFVEPGEQLEWRGKWKQYAYPGYISIARKAENYYVLGNTKWIGAQLADGSRVEHLGDLGGQLRVEKDHAYLGSMGTGSNANYDCAAEFVRVGRFLIVHDNAQCGGANVRFDGVYTMAPSRR